MAIPWYRESVVFLSKVIIPWKSQTGPFLNIHKIKILRFVNHPKKNKIHTKHDFNLLVSFLSFNYSTTGQSVVLV